MSTEAQISVRIGEVEFRARGTEDWVTKRVDAFLEKADSLIASAPIAPKGPNGLRNPPPPADTPPNGTERRTLPAFLTEVNAGDSQNKRFLATATWLHLRGSPRLTTGTVAKALKDHNQARLGNPSDCLLQCIGKGHCERDGKEFFVNDDGRRQLGVA